MAGMEKVELESGFSSPFLSLTRARQPAQGLLQGALSPNQKATFYSLRSRVCFPAFLSSEGVGQGDGGVKSGGQGALSCTSCKEYILGVVEGTEDGSYKWITGCAVGRVGFQGEMLTVVSRGSSGPLVSGAPLA